MKDLIIINLLAALCMLATSIYIMLKENKNK